jgi:divalent metal cation (Fe/Co/Zn/Cd) transporter
LLWVLIAGLIGFAVTMCWGLPIRVGSAALGAYGVQARSDGFTSLAVVWGVIGIWLGFPLADQLVRLVSCIAIVVCCGDRK